MSDAPNSILPIGRPFECVFGDFRPRLLFLSQHQLEITIPAAHQPVVQIVDFEAMNAGSGMVMLSWAEADGTVVVHLQNYPALVVLSHARLAGGALMRSTGRIRWLAA
jgi:hypothetical protein